MAKTRKILPKRIAGVKLPKDLRRAGNAAIDAAVEGAKSPKGREMIAAGLSLAAAASAASVRARTDAATKSAPGTPAAATFDPQGTPPAFAGPQVTAEAVGQMAEMMLGKLFAKR